MSRKTIIIFLLSISSLVSHAQEDIFIDTKLKALIAEAVENNSDFLSAGLNVGQAEAMLQAAKLTYLPSFAFVLLQMRIIPWVEQVLEVTLCLFRCNGN